MADSQFNDAAILATDPTFQGRIGSALYTYSAQVVSSETPSGAAGGTYVHNLRKNFAAQLLNNPTTFKPLFYNTVSCDATVLGVATASGATSLSSSGVSVATQAALVTDTMISNSVAATYNAFISGL